ncbi:MAG: phosphoenolpyruvate--protein phosphotransferase [Desulfatibacillaceae bacterium]
MSASSVQRPKERILGGTAGSPGICVGQAYILDRQRLGVVKKYGLESSQVGPEINRFKRAVKAAENELKSLIRKAPEELAQQTYILEAYAALLRDKMFYGRTVETIESEPVNAEWALKRTVDGLKQVFSRIQDDYIRERMTDIGHVYEMVMRQLTGAAEESMDKLHKRVIIVAHNLSPAETSQLQLDRVMGIVLDRGGRTSHTNIIARSLQIPAVLGLEWATSLIQTGDVIIVDGSRGTVVINPEEDTLLRYHELRDRWEAAQALMVRDSHLPAETTDGLRVSVKGNIELMEEVVQVNDRGGDGIGLYRTEFLYLNRSELPGEEELFDNFREVAELMAPRPVTIRTLDVNGDKVAQGIRPDEGENPALGLRAIRLCLKEPDILRTQIGAVYRAGAYGNVRLLYPMICCVEEIIAIREICRQVQEDLEKRGLPYNSEIETGIMVEVPSAAIMAHLFAPYVDFFSIGTNDLVQYTLAVDRNNRNVAHLFQHLHPAVVHLLRIVADVGKKHNVRLAMCGEMAGDPVNIPLLMGLGYWDLSMNPQAIPAAKTLIRKLDKRSCELLARDVVKLKTSEEILTFIKESLGDKLSGLSNSDDNGSGP